MRNLVVVMALVLAGCGGSPLEEIGDRSSSWLGSTPERHPDPEAVAEAPMPELVAATRVNWWNDDLSRPDASAVSLDVISSRRSPGDRFAQASRREIASFFPDLEFPAKVPAGVRAVTSQLVLAASDAAFEGAHIASFGMWRSDPYTSSRTVGQLATISVFAGVSDDPCALAGSDCEAEQVGSRTVGRVVRSAGQTVVWSDTERTYEMFVREPVAAAVPAMIESVTPISELVAGAAGGGEQAEPADEQPPPATVP